MDHQTLASLLAEAVQRNASVAGDLPFRSVELDSGGVPVTRVTVALCEGGENIRVLLANLLAALRERAGSAEAVALELFAAEKKIAYSGKIGARNFSLILEL